MEEWAEQANFLMVTSARRANSRQPATKLMFDGDKGYFYTWDAPNLGPNRLEITKEIDPSYWSKVTPAFAIGRRVLMSGRALPELIRSPSAVSAGLQTLAGSNYYRVDISDVESLSKQMLTVTAYLDPEHDFLPVRISVDYAEPGRPPNSVPQVWKTIAFTRVHDSAAGRDRWFPQAARMENLSGTYTLTMKSVRINENIPIERFRPEAPNGTIVGDHLAPEGRRSYIIGGADEEAALAIRTAERARQELAANVASGVSLDARPPRGGASIWILVFSSVALCGIAALAWLRQAH